MTALAILLQYRQNVFVERRSFGACPGDGGYAHSQTEHENAQHVEPSWR
jgi:hypothetical protein